MDGIVALLLSKKFTKDTVIGMGAIKGAACQVQSINKVGKTTTITLKWEDNVGVVHTQAFDVEDGLDGVSVQNAIIKPNGHLELTLSNGTTIDCGKVLPQYDTMPTPSSSNEGQILQYIGTTTSNYTNGYFYECINDGGTYKWVEKSVQDSYTKIEIGDIQNLPDNTKDVIQNINSLKLSIDQLQASKLSISDIDNALSNTSENPVQNKVIKLTIDQLKGSILDKLDEKEDKFRYSTMPTASVDYLNKIVEYIGATDSTYTNGYFYQCRFDGTNYEWVQKNIQPSGGSTGGDGVVDGYYNSTDHLFYEESTFINPITGDDNTIYVSLDTNLLYRYNGLIFIRVDESSSGEDDVINGYYNTTDGKFYEDSTYTTEIIGETGKIYISIDTNIQYRWDNISVPNKFVTISSSIDVDNALSITSENPVQNKVITAKINDLDALMATKLSISDIDNALSDVSENPVQNKVIKTEIDKLSASMLSASLRQKVVDLEPIYLIGSGLNFDRETGKLSATGIEVPIDSELSTESVNPVQNKVITLAMNQLQGSVLDKIKKRMDAQSDNFAIWDNQGEVIDSGISKNIVPTTASVSNKLLVASDLSVKADKVSGAIDNDIALLDSTGNLKDSTKKLSDLQDKLTEGDGIDIDTNNKISVDISYLTASRIGYIPSSEKGAHSGVAELDSTGKVPSSQLPSYIDDVIDGYYNDTDGKFYEDSSHTTEIVGESGKIYISVDTDIQYRWTGTAFAALGGALQLGETSSTAYRGDRGKIAYDHSQIKDGSNPHNTTADNVNLKVPISALSGSKLDVESTLYGVNTELGKKADKVTSATNGHLAGLDANGNLTDSGVVANDVIQKVATATGLLKDDGTVDTTEYQPKRLAVPIQTLSGSQLTVETALGGINDDVVKTFTGTQAQWDALSLADKQKYEICNITDDGSTDNVYTVGEVDALLDEKANVTAITNPNLLDNPWFTVNQRGASSYTSSGYSVDRWILGAGSLASRTANTPYILLTTLVANTNAWMRQKTEFDLDITKRITYSAIIESSVTSNYGFALKMSNMDDLTQSKTEWFATTSGEKTLVSMTELPYKNTAFEIVANSQANASVKIYALKAELGSVSTLAMDTAPNYTTELLKCQRYFVRYASTANNSSISFGAIATGNKQWYGVISLPVVMRAAPTITYDGTVFVYFEANTALNQNISSIAISNIMTNVGKLRANFADTTSLTVGMTGELQLHSGAYIDLSADL